MMMMQWTQKIQKCEVLDAKKDKYTLFWVLQVRSASEKEWTVVFTHCRGYEDVEWRVLTWDENGYWKRHSRGFITIPHRKMVKVYPQTVLDAIKFFQNTILPHILTHFPEF
jgi:hypothetical protein